MESDYLYTLAFIRRGSEILMLNREKAPWFGAWNGVGGKREAGESPLACILREIREETGLEVASAAVRFGGTLTWNADFRAASHGLYLFTATVPEATLFPTPLRTPEGILEWKRPEWILHPRNQGVASNIPAFLPDLLAGRPPRHWHCTFSGDLLVRVDSEPLSDE